jgi:hypothetical protein
VADRWRSSGRRLELRAAELARLSSGRQGACLGERGRELRAAGSGAGGVVFEGTTAAIEVTRTEKKRAERKGVCGYFLARRQDLWRRARCHADCHVTELGAIGCGAELCYLGATGYGVELRVQTCKLNFWGSKRKFLSRKGLKNKKFGMCYNLTL